MISSCQSFQVIRDYDGSFVFPIPDSIYKNRNLIYAFVECDRDNENLSINKIDNLKYLYIGKTGQELKARLYNHKHKIKYANKSEENLYSYLKKALKKDEKSYEVFIIDEAKNAEELNKKEIDAINKYKPIYNINEGGGGGSAFDPTRYSKLQSPLKTSSQENVSFPSPEKKYSIIKNENSTISIAFTPQGKKKSHIIYAITNIKTKETLIGETENSLEIRMGKYCHLFAHSDKDFYPELRENPLDWKITILYEVPFEQNPKDAEVYFIKKFKEMHPDRKLLNKNKGGGGGYSLKSLSKRLFCQISEPSEINTKIMRIKKEEEI